jgi:hypothetical protein
MRRSTALLIMMLVCASLVFVNGWTAEADAETTFRSAQYFGSDLDQVLAQRHSDQLTCMALEGGSALVGVAGVVALLLRR